jgi:DNA modification methylase
MLDMLEVIEPNTIDSIVTDPPYGLTSITKRFGKENSAECQYGKDGSFARLSRGFMGKEWDGSGIEYNIETWQKCYEVLKPGGYLLAFGGSRTFHRIACAIEDAGFEIRDTICYMYGSGFPKSQNIGKQLEKRYEDEKTKQKTEHDLLRMWERNIQKTKSNEKEQKNILFNKLQEQSMEKSSNTTSTLWRKEPSVERWNNIQKTERELQWCQICEMSKRVFINGEERWICNGTQNCNGEALREMFDKNGSCPSYRPQPEQQFNRELNAIQEQWGTQACREVIENWKKIGTALKPSFEPIIVARKPFKGSLVDNVIEYGVGGINIDECRIGTGTGEKKKVKYPDIRGDNYNHGHHDYDSTVEYEIEDKGRFPANTILTYDETDFNEVCGGFPNTKSGVAVRHNSGGNTFGGNNKKPPMADLGYNDSGSASRYFYCAKASKKDRDEGLDAFEEKDVGIGALRDSGRKNTLPKRNVHPTVKPTSLMQYLVRLVTPNGGVVLDPFNGSGSTGKAVMYENHDRNKNYKYIGIELTEEYLPIAKARIEYVCNLKPEEDPQTNIFDFIEDVK